MHHQPFTHVKLRAVQLHGRSSVCHAVGILLITIASPDVLEIVCHSSGDKLVEARGVEPLSDTA